MVGNIKGKGDAVWVNTILHLAMEIDETRQVKQRLGGEDMKSFSLTLEEA